MTFTSFLIYYSLKNLACNLTVKHNFDPYLKNQNFARHGTGGELSITTLVFIFLLYPGKTNDKI